VTNIHLLAAVLLLVPVGCSQPNARLQTRFNHDMELSGDLPYNPLQWEIIASTLNHSDHTLATVLGNDRAIAYARRNVSHEYSAGSVVSAITWSQQEDPRWFGGNIPSKLLLSVEFLEVQSVPDHGRTYLYTMYCGSPLRKLISTEERSPTGRAAYLLAQRAAVMP
jgi:hypothetical protein